MTTTQNFFDSANSTTTALAANGTYTGQWINVKGYNAVMCVAKSNVSGTLYMDFTNTDNPTVDETPESSLSYAIEAGITEPPHQLVPARAWFRARYINGSSQQTTFQLVTRIGSYSLVVAPLDKSLPKNADSISVRSISDEIDIARGLRRGYFIRNAFGRNPDIDTGTVPEDLWNGGGVYTGFPTGSAEKVTVVSSSVNDTSAGSGARTVKIFGLDANYALQEETVTLNGQSLVDSVNTYTRIYRARVITSGSSNTAFNAGTITIAHKITTANIFCVMPIGYNQTAIGIYTIPANNIGLLRSFRVFIDKTAGGSPTAQGALWIREFGASPRLNRMFSLSQSAPVIDEIYGGLLLPAKTDIAIRITSVSTNDIVCTGSMDFVVVES